MNSRDCRASRAVLPVGDGDGDVVRRAACDDQEHLTVGILRHDEVIQLTAIPADHATLVGAGCHVLVKAAIPRQRVGG